MAEIALAELDRIDLQKQMVLKFAAIIGPVFTTQQLAHILPACAKARMHSLLDMLVGDKILKRLENTEVPEDKRGATEGLATSGQAGSGKRWLQHGPRSAVHPKGPAHPALCRGKFPAAAGSASATVLAGAARSTGRAPTAAARNQSVALPQLGRPCGLAPALAEARTLCLAGVERPAASKETAQQQSGILAFSAPLLWEASYELWPIRQTVNIHHKCAAFLQRHAHKCQRCHGGDFVPSHRFGVSSPQEQGSCQGSADKHDWRSWEALVLAGEHLRRARTYTPDGFLAEDDQTTVRAEDGGEHSCQCEAIAEAVLVPLARHYMAVGSASQAFYYLLECAAAYLHVSNSYMVSRAALAGRRPEGSLSARALSLRDRVRAGMTGRNTGPPTADAAGGNREGRGWPGALHRCSPAVCVLAPRPS